MKVLELFAGSRSVGKIAEDQGHTVFSSDIEPFDKIDYPVDILEFDVTKVPFIPDFIWASPPCTFFSVASIGHHWNRNNTPKSENALKGVEIVQKTIDIINYFLDKNPSLVFYFENPTGKLRKLPVVRGNFDRANITYCSYGDNRMKPTDIWTNNLYSMYNENGWLPRPKCFSGNVNCPHDRAPRGSKTGGTQGRKGAYDRSKIPSDLCLEIIVCSALKIDKK